jgi:hypothetical protein
MSYCEALSMWFLIPLWIFLVILGCMVIYAMWQVIKP